MPCRFRAQCRSAGRSRQSRRVCQRVRSPRASSSFVYVRVFRSSYAEPNTLRTDSAHYSHRYREAVKGCFAKSYDELCAQSWDWHVRAVRTLTRMLTVSSLPTSPHPRTYLIVPIGTTIHALPFTTTIGLSSSPVNITTCTHTYYITHCAHSNTPNSTINPGLC